MTIKEVISYVTTDGVSHSDLDKAAAHERHVLVQDHLAHNYRDLNLSLETIGKMATVICDTQEAMAKIFAMNLKASVATPSVFVGGKFRVGSAATPAAGIHPKGEEIVTKATTAAAQSAFENIKSKAAEKTRSEIIQQVISNLSPSDARSYSAGLTKRLQDADRGTRKEDLISSDFAQRIWPFGHIPLSGMIDKTDDFESRQDAARKAADDARLEKATQDFAADMAAIR